MLSNSKYEIRNLQFAFCFLLFALSSFLSACSTKTESPSNDNSVKFQQYYVKGEQHFLKTCSNCHQKTGKGLGLLYPPLDQSDFVDKNFEQVICLMKNGINGEIIVNGKGFNKAMPAIPSLTDIEVAEIATYIYNSWGRERGIVEVQDATRILLNCDSSLVGH